MRIEPLSKDTLEEAASLAERVFSGEHVSPRESFEASLDPEQKRAYVERSAAGHGVTDLEYWVARDDVGRVIGMTGLYRRQEDEGEALWLGWHCVDPQERGRGVGGNLLDFVIAEARRRAAGALRLFTSTHPDEASAQTLYEKRGLKVVKEGEEVGERQARYRLLYRELLLR